MCLIFQETSEDVLLFKTRSLAFIKVLKATEAWSSTGSSIDTLYVKVYEIQFFGVDFHLIHWYMFGLSFLTTLNKYKDYFKGHQRLHECEAKFCSCKLWLETKFSLIHLSLEKATVFVHRRVLWPMSFLVFIVWWTEEFCSQHLSQVSE